MLIKHAGIQLNIESIINNESRDESVFFLHGFTGSAEDWVPIVSSLNKKFNYYCVDLIGHGKSDSPSEGAYYGFESITGQLKEIITELSTGKIIIAGYSYGGRAALKFAIKNGYMLKGLILESSTYGISDEQIRKERIIQDNKLAEFILNNPIEIFIDHWMNSELFNTQKQLPIEVISRIRESKLKNNRAGLANCLKYSGTGIMGNLSRRLKDIPVKTLLITGELDKKFTDINREMVNLIPESKHQIIENTGHNIHLEKPQIFIDAVNSFLSVI